MSSSRSRLTTSSRPSSSSARSEKRWTPPPRTPAPPPYWPAPKKAQRRGDVRAQLTFAERGLALEPTGADVRLWLQFHQAESVGRLGEYSRSRALAAALIAEAAAAGRPQIEGRAFYLKSVGSWITPKSANAEQAIADLRRARALLTDAQDWRYLTYAVEFLGYEGWWFGDMDQAAERWQEMAAIAHEHGLVDREVQAIPHLGQVEAIRNRPEGRRARLKEALELADHGANRLTKARILRQLGTFTSINESAEEGRRMLRESATVLDELGDTEELTMAYQFEGDIDMMDGNYRAALTMYEKAMPYLQEHVGFLPEVERRAAGALLELGDVMEAESMARQP